MTRQIHKRLPNLGKRLVILAPEPGGAAHCQGAATCADDLELLSRRIFDCLTQVCSPP